jgi:NADPH2:quinone reductase
MRAWLLNAFKGLDALHLRENVPEPAVGAGEVLIRLRYAALNPADRFLAENLYPAQPELPHVLGRDGSGLVEAVGAGVSAVKRGDQVAILRGDAGVDRKGTFAEYVAVPEEVVVPVPDGWELEQAAAGPLVYLTAYQALTQWGPLGPSTVMITGVSGGVGVAALHLAKAIGHRVIGLSRSAEKRAALAKMGANLLLHPYEDDIKARIKEFTQKKGVDLVIDNVAGELFNTVVDTLAYGGRISVIGMLGGPVPSFNTAKLLFRRARIGGVLVSDYKGAEARRVWDEIVSLLRKINGKPVIDSVFPMEQLMEAFAKLAEGPLGKVLLNVSGATAL